MLTFISGFLAGVVFASYYDLTKYVHAVIKAVDGALEKRAQA